MLQSCGVLRCSIMKRQVIKYAKKGVPVLFLTEHHAMKAYWGMEA